MKTKLNLHLFETAGGGAAAAAGANPAGGEPAAPNTEAPASSPDQSNSSQSTGDARRAEFEKLIKGEYKDLFDERAQKMIDTRFKQNKTLEEQASRAKALDPVLELLSSKYGVDSSDVESLVKAIQEDDSYYEEEALQKGLTVEQLKHMKQIERENAEFKRAAQEQKRKQETDRIYSQWQQQSEDCKKFYPNFDLKAECSAETGKSFLGLLKSGVDVKTAFEVIHKDELIGGAMQYTAQKIQQKTVNDIRARGMRPTENGASGNSPAMITKSDPRLSTKEGRAELARLAMRGVRIEL